MQKARIPTTPTAQRMDWLEGTFPSQSLLRMHISEIYKNACFGFCATMIPYKRWGEFIIVDLGNKCNGIQQEIQKFSTYVTPLRVARNSVTNLKCTNNTHWEYCTDLRKLDHVDNMHINIHCIDCNMKILSADTYCNIPRVASTVAVHHLSVSKTPLCTCHICSY